MSTREMGISKGRSPGERAMAHGARMLELGAPSLRFDLARDDLRASCDSAIA